VIPLAASLGGKATEGLIQRLTERVNAADTKRYWVAQRSPPFLALGHCLADEAAARPETIRAALRALVRLGLGDTRTAFVPMLVRGRYGSELRDEAERLFLSTGQKIFCTANALHEVVRWQTVEGEEGLNLSQIASRFLEMLGNSERMIRCKAALGCAALLGGPTERWKWKTRQSIFEPIGGLLVPLLYADDPRENFVAAWALLRLGRNAFWTPPRQPDVLGRMFELWQHSPSECVRNIFPVTFAAQVIAPRDDGHRCASVNTSDVQAVFKRYDELDEYREKAAALVVAWYSRFLSDPELVQRTRVLLAKRRPHPDDKVLKQLLRHLGVNPEKPK
jgi:hypothetical protein